MIRTKIICTIGPVSESYDMLKSMSGAGMNVARLNVSHGDHAWHQKVIRHIKTLNRQIPTPIAILLDTQGPEIRTGSISEDLDRLVDVDGRPQAVRSAPLKIPGPDDEVVESEPAGRIGGHGVQEVDRPFRSGPLRDDTFERT